VCFSNDGHEFSGSIFQKVNDKLEAGAQLSWTGPSGSDSTTRFGIGAKFLADKDTTFRVKHTQINACFVLKLWRNSIRFETVNNMAYWWLFKVVNSVAYWWLFKVVNSVAYWWLFKVAKKCGLLVAFQGG
jgi:Eukaryotic porin